MFATVSVPHSQRYPSIGSPSGVGFGSEGGRAVSLMEKINLKTLTRPELIRFVESLGEKPFRASQIWSWMYRKGAGSFDAMTNLSSAFRERLSRAADLRSIVKEGESVSRRSGTRKFLWRLEDGVRIESVFIPEGNRKTVCISSQAGCALGCSFCATGGMGFIRNLHFDEIVDQVVSVGRENRCVIFFTSTIFLIFYYCKLTTSKCFRERFIMPEAARKIAFHYMN